MRAEEREVLRNLRHNRFIVWVFPKPAVCLDCGFTEFTVPETETQVLREGTATSTAA